MLLLLFGLPFERNKTSANAKFIYQYKLRSNSAKNDLLMVSDWLRDDLRFLSATRSTEAPSDSDQLKKASGEQTPPVGNMYPFSSECV